MSATQSAILFPEGPGYLLVKNLTNAISSDQGEIQLVQSVATGELCLRKRYHRERSPYAEGLPVEVRFSTHNGFPRSLPCFTCLLDWADYSKRFGEGSVALVFKHLNGGRFDQWCQRFVDEKKLVPEAVIWKFIYALGSAMAYLHLGYEDGRPLPATWDTIAHRDMDACNIMMHYDEADPNGMALPYPVVIDFGYACRVSDEEYPNRFPDMEEEDLPASVDADPVGDDLQFLGHYPRMLCFPHRVLTRADIWHMVRHFGFADGSTEAYSEELIDTIHGVCQQEFVKGRLEATRKVVDVILPLAKRKLQEYIDAGNLESLEWAKPETPQNRPIRADWKAMHPQPWMPLAHGPLTGPWSAVNATPGAQWSIVPMQDPPSFVDFSRYYEIDANSSDFVWPKYGSDEEENSEQGRGGEENLGSRNNGGGNLPRHRRGGARIQGKSRSKRKSSSTSSGNVSKRNDARWIRDALRMSKPKPPDKRGASSSGSEGEEERSTGLAAKIPKAKKIVTGSGRVRKASAIERKTAVGRKRTTVNRS